MNALIAEARKKYHKELLSSGVMTIDSKGIPSMYDKYTFVEVPREYGKEVLEAMKNAKIKGRSVNMEPANQK